MDVLLRWRKGAMDLFDVDAFDFGYDALRDITEPPAHAISPRIEHSYRGRAIDPDLALHQLLDGAHQAIEAAPATRRIDR
jgi:hypothetical protein